LEDVGVPTFLIEHEVHQATGARGWRRWVVRRVRADPRRVICSVEEGVKGGGFATLPRIILHHLVLDEWLWQRE
jgi:hypothetical protein